jgi:hypothetical protein
MEAFEITAKAAQGRHELSKLFGALGTQIKVDLERAYSRHTSRQKAASLESAFAAYNNAFVEWRYPFEDPEKGKCGSIDGLIDLSNFLGGYILTLKNSTVGQAKRDVLGHSEDPIYNRAANEHDLKMQCISDGVDYDAEDTVP